MNKLELRKNLKNQSINEEQKALEQKYLLNALWNLLKSSKPTCLGLYAAIKDEIDLFSIFKKCQQLGIHTAYPRISEDKITFHKVDSYEDLISGLFDILEPPHSAKIVIPDLLVVPGLAFTKDGKRLGRGKGHYDKYLKNYPISTVSLAFSWQILDELPTEPHDVYIDKIISFFN